MTPDMNAVPDQAVRDLWINIPQQDLGIEPPAIRWFERVVMIVAALIAIAVLVAL